MSNDDDEITRIEDLPDLTRSEEEEEDFQDLDALAKDMGIESTQAIDLPSDLPDLPSENIESLEESSIEENDFESTIEDNDHNSFLSEDSDFSTETNQFETENSFNDDIIEEAQEPHFVNDDVEIEKSEEENQFFNKDQDEQDSEDFFKTSEEEENWEVEEPTAELITEESLNHISESQEKEIKTEIQRETEQVWEKPEEFTEVKEFGNNINFGSFTTEGNPPFSIIIKDLKYFEDVEEIMAIMLELGFIQEDSITDVRQNLERGQLLIPRLSEYAAIILSHKLRRFDAEILMGLTEELTPPKSYSSNDKGLSNKNTIFNNKKYHKENPSFLTKDKILATTLPQISGHVIKEHLGIISHTKNITSSDLKHKSIEDEILNNVPIENRKNINKLRLERENLLASQSEYHSIDEIYSTDPNFQEKQNLNNIYQEILEELKDKAIGQNANGILGINFTIGPIGIENMLESDNQYQILCTGNMVWLEKN